MSVRSLNKAIIIGNLTRDPNLRFTPSNAAVCSFGVATNRSWVTQDSGEKQERTDFHNVVAWGKLAEICGNLLHKGDKVYVEGRMQTRDWKTQEGEDRRITEIVIDDMILLNSRHSASAQDDQVVSDDSQNAPADDNKQSDDTDEEVVEDEVSETEDVSDDIPF